MSLEDIIEHAGVKGMKWGKRKASGSKSSGKQRQTLKDRAKKNVNSIKRERQWTDQYKRRGSMSDSELRAKIDRLRLENDFGKLAGEAKLSQRKKAKAVMDGYSKVKNSSSGKALKSAIAKSVAKKAATAAVL